MLEVSNGGISSLNLLGIGQNQNNIEELNIIDDTIINLEKWKNYYADIYANVSGCFQNYLRSASNVLIEEMQDDLRLNMFSDIDLKSKHNKREIFETFDRFFFAFGIKM